MKVLYTILGSISLALGILGIFLPLLPTTPFLLLSAALYFRGSEKMYRWLLSHPRFGPFIRNFREKKAIPLHAKIISVTMLWATMSYCIFAIAEQLWLRLILIAIAVTVTIHILSYKTGS